VKNSITDTYRDGVPKSNTVYAMPGTER